MRAGGQSASPLTGLGVDEYYRRTDGAGPREMLTDALGSVLALADEAGQLRTTYRYEPYGATVAQGEMSSNPFQYTGRENDGTGLYYYRARYYHPELARFVAEDPIKLAGGINAYTYVEGDPISLIDLLGLSPSSPNPQSGGTGSCRTWRRPKLDFLEPIHPECSIPALRFICAAAGVGDAGEKFGAKGKSGKQKDGTPGNNQAQNKQANDAAKEAGLNRAQQRELHETITGENFDYHEVLDVARQIKNGQY